jgi:hypothetical protein
VFGKAKEAKEELRRRVLIRFFRRLDEFLFPVGFEVLNERSDEYIQCDCKYINPEDYRFQKSRGICYYLRSDHYEFKSKKSKKKHKIALLVNLENDFYNKLWYGLSFWNESTPHYMTDAEDLEKASVQFGIEENGLFQGGSFWWNYFTSEDDEDNYCFYDMTDPVKDMYTKEGLDRQVKHIVGDIQRVIDIFDKNKKHQVDSSK